MYRGNYNSVARFDTTMVNYEVVDDDTVICDLRLKLELIPLFRELYRTVQGIPDQIVYVDLVAMKTN